MELRGTDDRREDLPLQQIPSAECLKTPPGVKLFTTASLFWARRFVEVAGV